jgi:redox-sensitive bicupin YhaK (pirin superfamily)
MAAPQVEIRRAADRFAFDNEWLRSRGTFPMAGNFDLAKHAHGVLMINNDDIVDSGYGFDTHQHREAEIITWVLDGSVVHQDTLGNSGVIYPGLAQRMSAGRGIRHSERNDSWRLDGERHDQPLRVVQMWIPPDTGGLDPQYEEREVDAALDSGALVAVASGMKKHRDEAAIGFHNRYATLFAARLQAGQSITLPDAPFGHVYLPLGAADMEGAGLLEAGDSVRLTATGGQRLTASAPSEVLVWEMHASFS